jgi:hypothetical protein
LQRRRNARVDFSRLRIHRVFVANNGKEVIGDAAEDIYGALSAKARAGKAKELLDSRSFD